MSIAPATAVTRATMGMAASVLARQSRETGLACELWMRIPRVLELGVFTPSSPAVRCPMPSTGGQCTHE